MKLVLALLLLLANPAFAADAALFSMSDAQFKTYATHEMGIATRTLANVAEQIDKYREECVAGSLKSCESGPTLARIGMAKADATYVEIYGAAKARNSGKTPKWVEKLSKDHTAALSKIAAALNALNEATKGATR